MWIKKGDLVEFQLKIRNNTGYKVSCAPTSRFNWKSRYSKPLIRLECDKSYVGLVVDVYRVSWSRHVADPVVPNAKKQPGPRQKLFQENFTEWYFHVLWEDKVLLIEGSKLNKPDNYRPSCWVRWEMKALQEELIP